MSTNDDDDDWVGTPPEGHSTRDRARPEFWRDKIGRILIDLGYVSEKDVLSVLSQQLDIPLFDGEYPAVPLEATALPYRFLRAFYVIPVHLEGTVLSIVMAIADSATYPFITTENHNHAKKLSENSFSQSYSP